MVCTISCFIVLFIAVGNCQSRIASGVGDTDTNAIINRLDAGFSIFASNPDSAFLLINQGLDNSLKAHFKFGIAKAYADLAYLQTVKGNYERSLFYYRQALPNLTEKRNDKLSLAKFYSAMSGPYFQLSMYDSMYYYLRIAERITEGIKISSRQQALDATTVYINLALVWAGVADYKRGCMYLDKCESVLKPYIKEPTVQAVMANVNNFRGLFYLEEDNYVLAKHFFKRSLNAFAENAYALTGMAKVQIKASKIKEAVALLEKAIQISDRSKDYLAEIFAKVVLGELYYEMGDFVRSKTLLTDVIHKSRNKGDGDSEYTSKAYSYLSSIMAREGDFKTAYSYQTKSIELLNSINLKVKKIAFYTVESRLRFAENEKIIAGKQLLLNKAAARINDARLRLIIILIGSILIITILSAIYGRRENKHRLQLKELQTIQKEQRISHLQSFIKGEELERTRLAREIHDGIMVQLSNVKTQIMVLPAAYRQFTCENYMNTIYFQELVFQMEEAMNDLRGAAHNLMPDMLIAGGLKETVLYFCSSVKKNATLSITCQFYGSLEGLGASLELSAYRIIQELIQNVIKHADASKVLVQVSRLSDVLSITIEDNGRGYDKEERTPEGMGFKSIRNRLLVHDGQIDIRSGRGSGTSVYIEFELSNPSN